MNESRGSSQGISKGNQGGSAGGSKVVAQGSAEPGAKEQLQSPSGFLEGACAKVGDVRPGGPPEISRWRKPPVPTAKGRAPEGRLKITTCILRRTQLRFSGENRYTHPEGLMAFGAKNQADVQAEMRRAHRISIAPPGLMSFFGATGGLRHRLISVVPTGPMISLCEDVLLRRPRMPTESNEQGPLTQTPSQSA